MTNIFNIALTGFLVFSGMSTPSDSASSFIELPSNESKIEISSVRLTGYNAVAEQTNSEPHITASGVRSNPHVVIARSRDMADILPYGTIVALDVPAESRECGFSKVSQFVGYRVVSDTMHKRKMRQMDVLFATHDSISLGEREVNPATAMGVCEANVRVVGHVSLEKIPKTQQELVWLVEGKQLSMK
ncbi:MAG: hypothetical protein WD003_01090 [Candidatus Paceibacterota bacterium]